jgi:integrase/recombinase XerD
MPEGSSYAEAKSTEKALMGLRRRTVRASSPISTVKDLFPSYLSWYHGHRSKTTWHDVNGSWERDLAPFFEQYVITEIEATHYSAYQALRATQVSTRTVNKELDYFSGFLHWCRRERKLDIPRIDYERLPYSRPVPIVLSPNEISRILAAAESEPVYYALFLCLYTLGLRISAARGIKVEDFDFENRAVRVFQKGGNWKLLPISDKMIESVKKIIKLNDLKSGEYVFSVRDKQPVQNLCKAIARICKRAGVTKKVNPHLFRHTIATHLTAAGVNTRTVQNYMDHAQIETTEGYTHIALENLRSAQNAVLSAQKHNDSVDIIGGCEYNI